MFAISWSNHDHRFRMCNTFKDHQTFYAFSCVKLNACFDKYFTMYQGKYSTWFFSSASFWISFKYFWIISSNSYVWILYVDLSVFNILAVSIQYVSAIRNAYIHSFQFNITLQCSHQAWQLISLNLYFLNVLLRKCIFCASRRCHSRLHNGQCTIQCSSQSRSLMNTEKTLSHFSSSFCLSDFQIFHIKK